jgi:GH18 family chitinase
MWQKQIQLADITLHYIQDLKQNSTDASIRKFTQAGISFEKNVLGVALYSRSWEVVFSKYHGLYQNGGPTKNEFALPLKT